MEETTLQNLKRAAAVGVTSALLATGLAAATASPAQAAAVGGSCPLSANWIVKFSATYDQPGNNSYLRYIVMNSPGPIRQWRITIRDNRGTLVAGGTLGNPAQLSRVDVEESILMPQVYLEVWGGNGSCNTTLRPYSF
jgi:hypothetical protein